MSENFERDTHEHGLPLGKIVVPMGMFTAASRGFDLKAGEGQLQRRLASALQTALRWLSENPIVPSEEQIAGIRRDWPLSGVGSLSEFSAIHWQRIMFLAPEPESVNAREAVRDLRWGGEYDLSESHNRQLEEAFRRGQNSK